MDEVKSRRSVVKKNSLVVGRWNPMNLLFVYYHPTLWPLVNFINMLMRSFYSQKCFGAQLLFNQQNYAQFYQYTQLEVTPNLYAACSTLCASKISINLLVQKLLIERIWNWHHIFLSRPCPKFGQTFVVREYFVLSLLPL